MIAGYGDKITSTLLSFLSTKLPLKWKFWGCDDGVTIMLPWGIVCLEMFQRQVFPQKLRLRTYLPTTRIDSREYHLDSPPHDLLHTSLLFTRIAIMKITRDSWLATSAFGCLRLAREGMKGLQQPRKWENLWHWHLQLQKFLYCGHNIAKCS